MNAVDKFRVVARLLLLPLLVSCFVIALPGSASAEPSGSDTSSVTAAGSGHDSSCIWSIEGNDGTPFSFNSTPRNAWYRCYFHDWDSWGGWPTVVVGSSNQSVHCVNTSCFAGRLGTWYSYQRIESLTETANVQFLNGSGFFEGYFRMSRPTGSFSNVTALWVASITGTAGAVDGSQTDFGDYSGSRQIGVPWSSFDSTWPTYNFGERYSSVPPNVCDRLEYSITALTGYLPPLAPGFVVDGGDSVTFEVDAGPSYSPGDAFDLSFRFHSGQQWGELINHTGINLALPLPQDRVVTRSGPPHLLAEFEVRCWDPALDAYTYWTYGAGSSDSPGLDACSLLDVTFELTEPSSGGSFVLYDGAPGRQILVGESLRVSASASGLPFPVDVTYGAAEDGDVLIPTRALGSLSGSGTLTDTYVIPNDGSVLLSVPMRSVYVGCTLPTGETRYQGSLDPDFGTLPPDFGEGQSRDYSKCFTFEGMSLTSPSTWLRGIGRMSVCLVVPDSDYLAEDFEEVKTELRSNAPFSWAVNGYDMAADATVGLEDGVDSTSSACVWELAGLSVFDPTLDGSTQASFCPAALVLPGQPLDDWSQWRYLLGKLVAVAWGFGVAALAFRGLS